jgi:DNA-binding MarR family transcriptional regulator
MQADDLESAPPVPRSLRARPGALLFIASQAAQKVANERLASLGFSVRAFGVLTTLAELGPLSQQAIGDHLQIDRTTMVSMMDELEGSSLVRRERNPRDRRAYAVTLTGKGRTAQRRAAKALDGARDEFFAPLSPPERQQLFELLDRLVDR